MADREKKRGRKKYKNLNIWRTKIALLSLLLTFGVNIVNFEHVIVGWAYADKVRIGTTIIFNIKRGS